MSNPCLRSFDGCKELSQTKDGRCPNCEKQTAPSVFSSKPKTLKSSGFVSGNTTYFPNQQEMHKAYYGRECKRY